MKQDVELFLKQLMVELLTLRAECSPFTLKPAHSSPYLPVHDEDMCSIVFELISGFRRFSKHNKTSL